MAAKRLGEDGGVEKDALSDVSVLLVLEERRKEDGGPVMPTRQERGSVEDAFAKEASSPEEEAMSVCVKGPWLLSPLQPPSRKRSVDPLLSTFRSSIVLSLSSAAEADCSVQPPQIRSYT